MSGYSCGPNKRQLKTRLKEHKNNLKLVETFGYLWTYNWIQSFIWLGER